MEKIQLIKNLNFIELIEYLNLSYELYECLFMCDSMSFGIWVCSFATKCWGMVWYE